MLALEIFAGIKVSREVAMAATLRRLPRVSTPAIPDLKEKILDRGPLYTANVQEANL